MLNTIFRMLLSTCAINMSANSGESKLTTHIFGSKVFSIQLPSTWNRDLKSEHFSVSSPDGRISVTASAFTKQDGTLKEFSSIRFSSSSMHEWYKPVSKVQQFKSVKGSGVFREFEGIWPGESKPTYYVVACLDIGKVFVSITFTTDRQFFNEYRAQCIQMLQSIQPCA